MPNNLITAKNFKRTVVYSFPARKAVRIILREKEANSEENLTSEELNLYKHKREKIRADCEIFTFNTR